MGDTPSKEELVKQAVEDAKRQDSEGNQNSPPTEPKLLNVLKMKEQLDQGNSETENLHSKLSESGADSEPEVIDLEDLETEHESTEDRSKEDTKSEPLLEHNQDDCRETDNETPEEYDPSVKRESLTLLEILKTGKESEFNSSTKPKIAEVLRDKSWLSEWKSATKLSQTSFEEKPKTPKILSIMRGDSLQEKLGNLAKTRNSAQILAERSKASEKSTDEGKTSEKEQKHESNPPGQNKETEDADGKATVTPTEDNTSNGESSTPTESTKMDPDSCGTQGKNSNDEKPIINGMAPVAKKNDEDVKPTEVAGEDVSEVSKIENEPLKETQPVAVNETDTTESEVERETEGSEESTIDSKPATNSEANEKSKDKDTENVQSGSEPTSEEKGTAKDEESMEQPEMSHIDLTTDETTSLDQTESHGNLEPNEKEFGEKSKHQEEGKQEDSCEVGNTQENDRTGDANQTEKDEETHKIQESDKNLYEEKPDPGQQIFTGTTPSEDTERQPKNGAASEAQGDREHMEVRDEQKEESNRPDENQTESEQQETNADDVREELKSDLHGEVEHQGKNTAESEEAPVVDQESENRLDKNEELCDLVDEKVEGDSNDVKVVAPTVGKDNEETNLEKNAEKSDGEQQGEPNEQDAEPNDNTNKTEVEELKEEIKLTEKQSAVVLEHREEEKLEEATDNTADEGENDGVEKLVEQKVEIDKTEPEQFQNDNYESRQQEPHSQNEEIKTEKNLDNKQQEVTNEPEDNVPEITREQKEYTNHTPLGGTKEETKTNEDTDDKPIKVEEAIDDKNEENIAERKEREPECNEDNPEPQDGQEEKVELMSEVPLNSAQEESKGSSNETKQKINLDQAIAENQQEYAHREKGEDNTDTMFENTKENVAEQNITEHSSHDQLNEEVDKLEDADPKEAQQETKQESLVTDSQEAKDEKKSANGTGYEVVSDQPVDEERPGNENPTNSEGISTLNSEDLAQNDGSNSSSNEVLNDNNDLIRSSPDANVNNYSDQQKQIIETVEKIRSDINLQLDNLLKSLLSK